MYCITVTSAHSSEADLGLSSLSTLSTLKYMPFSIREKRITLFMLRQWNKSLHEMNRCPSNSYKFP